MTRHFWDPEPWITYLLSFLRTGGNRTTFDGMVAEDILPGDNVIPGLRSLFPFTNGIVLAGYAGAWIKRKVLV